MSTDPTWPWPPAKFWIVSGTDLNSLTIRKAFLAFADGHDIHAFARALLDTPGGRRTDRALQLLRKKGLMRYDGRGRAAGWALTDEGQAVANALRAAAFRAAGAR